LGSFLTAHESGNTLIRPISFYQLCLSFFSIFKDFTFPNFLHATPVCSFFLFALQFLARSLLGFSGINPQGTGPEPRFYSAFKKHATKRHHHNMPTKGEINGSGDSGGDSGIGGGGSSEKVSTEEKALAAAVESTAEAVEAVEAAADSFAELAVSAAVMAAEAAQGSAGGVDVG
jgi:hypothetical protein